MTQLLTLVNSTWDPACLEIYKKGISEIIEMEQMGLNDEEPIRPPFKAYVEI